MVPRFGALVADTRAAGIFGEPAFPLDLATRSACRVRADSGPLLAFHWLTRWRNLRERWELASSRRGAAIQFRSPAVTTRARGIVRTSAVAPPHAATLQYLRAAEVCALLRISRPTLWRLRRDREFPAPTSLSRRSIGWRQSDVEQWLNSRTPDSQRASQPDRRASVDRQPGTSGSKCSDDAATRTRAVGRAARPHRGSQLSMGFGRDPSR